MACLLCSPVCAAVDLVVRYCPLQKIKRIKHHLLVELKFIITTHSTYIHIFMPLKYAYNFLHILMPCFCNGIHNSVS